MKLQRRMTERTPVIMLCKIFNQLRIFVKGYHSMGRSRGAVWINGKKTILPDGDPGGEHE